MSQLNKKDRNNRKVPVVETDMKQKMKYKGKKMNEREEGESDYKMKVRQTNTQIGAHVAWMNHSINGKPILY